LLIWKTQSKNLQGSLVADISDRGVELIKQDSNTFIVWSGFETMVETNKHVCLFKQKSIFTFPKRFFQPEQLSKFLEIVKSQPNIKSIPSRSA